MCFCPIRQKLLVKSNIFSCPYIQEPPSYREDKLKEAHFFAVVLFGPHPSPLTITTPSVNLSQSFFSLCRRQCSGSVTFWYGSGSESAEPYLWLLDPAPDPALFVSDLQDINKKNCLKIYFIYYFLKVHLYHSSKIKVIKSRKTLDSDPYLWPTDQVLYLDLEHW